MNNFSALQRLCLLAGTVKGLVNIGRLKKFLPLWVPPLIYRPWFLATWGVTVEPVLLLQETHQQEKMYFLVSGYLMPRAKML